MLKQLKKGLSFNLNKISLLSSSNQLTYLSKYNFSGGHHSGSDSEHEHHQSTTSASDLSESEDILNFQRNQIFRAKAEKFSVDSLLDGIKTPLRRAEQGVEASSLNLFKTNEEYINFLASNFEKHALKRYPEYKTHLNEFKDRIVNYDKLNAYQKEVVTLEFYMLWKLEKLREESVTAFQSDSQNPLDQLRNRFKLISSKFYLYHRNHKN